MGHTLVARFEPNDLEPFFSALSKWNGKPVNKIPFGRKCDREEANRILPYHMTLLHWPRSADTEMLGRMNDLTFSPCSVVAKDLHVGWAEENSSLLYLSVVPGEGFAEWVHAQEKAVGASFSSFLHMTVAVSKNPREIEQLQCLLRRELTFPFALRICALELYHIWEPVKLVEIKKE